MPKEVLEAKIQNAIKVYEASKTGTATAAAVASTSTAQAEQTEQTVSSPEDQKKKLDERVAL